MTVIIRRRNSDDTGRAPGVRSLDRAWKRAFEEVLCAMTRLKTERRCAVTALGKNQRVKSIACGTPGESAKFRRVALHRYLAFRKRRETAIAWLVFNYSCHTL